QIRRTYLLAFDGRTMILFSVETEMGSLLQSMVLMIGISIPIVLVLRTFQLFGSAQFLKRVRMIRTI
ncbi:hypothetical protein C5L43_03455, partial [Ectopseudomonas oleovorans]